MNAILLSAMFALAITACAMLFIVLITAAWCFLGNIIAWLITKDDKYLHYIGLKNESKTQ